MSEKYNIEDFDAAGSGFGGTTTVGNRGGGFGGTVTKTETTSNTTTGTLTNKNGDTYRPGKGGGFGGTVSRDNNSTKGSKNIESTLKYLIN